MTDHLQRCRGRALAYADDLIATINAGRMNKSAFHGVMASFLEQPAYPPDFRPHLLEIALSRLEKTITRRRCK